MEESEINPEVQEKVESLEENPTDQNINNAVLKNAESNPKNDSIFKRVLENGRWRDRWKSNCNLSNNTR